MNAVHSLPLPFCPSYLIITGIYEGSIIVLFDLNDSLSDKEMYDD